VAGLKQLGRRPGARLGQRFARLLKSLAAVSGAAGVVFIALQCLWWFQNGYWTPKTLFDLWLWLGNSYSIHASSGSDRILLWVLDLPLGGALIASALILLLAGRALDP
jgi:hypothetical protein